MLASKDVKLSMAQVIDLARRAGLPSEALAVAGAIAKAESGLDTEAVGVNGPTPGCPNGSHDLGLWQINDCYSRIVNAFDPATNARAMAQISSNGTNWHPWATFNNGAYKRFMAEAEAAAPGQKSIGGALLKGVLVVTAAGVFAWAIRHR